MEESKSDLREQCIDALKIVMDAYGYRQANYITGNAVLYGCKFYQTEFKNVLVTDYDVIGQKPLNDKSVFVFNKETGVASRVALWVFESEMDYVKNHLKEISCT
jgi:hypothetical protein